MPLFAPAELRERYDAFMGEPDFLGAAFDGGEVRAGAWMVGPFQVEARPVLHALNSHGFRVSIAGDRTCTGARRTAVTARRGATCFR